MCLTTSLAESLDHLRKNATCALHLAIFDSLYRSIKAGKAFGEALSHLPIPFCTQKLRLIEQGEINNRLEKVFAALISTLEAKAERASQVKKKMIYPCVLLFSTLVFFHFLLLVLFPNIHSLYDSLGRPAPTWLTISGSSSLFLWGGDVAIFCLFFLLARKGGALFSKLPFFKQFPLTNSRLNWLNLFTLQIISQVPLGVAFRIATEASQHASLQAVFSQALSKIQQGVPPSQALAHNHLIPVDWTLSFQIGERNNSLGTLCQKLIQKENAQLMAKINSLITLIEPLTLLLLGGAILFLIMALYGPLLNAYSSYT